ncbi:MAG: hypothetical protein P4L33_10590 [Capsulimonadaceae bacterium]|nr:hypothetical protein [Capsulimonadaceae bacterium]
MANAEEFAAIVRAARSAQVRLDAKTIRDVDGLLAAAAAQISADIRSVPRGTLSDRYRREIVKELNGTLDTLRISYKATLDGGIDKAAKIAVEREQGILSALKTNWRELAPGHAASLFGSADKIGVEFARVPAQVLDRLYARTYSDGLTLSKRLYNMDRAARKAVAGEIYKAIATGASARKTAKAIEPLLTAAGSENVRYNALRIARTEIGTAFREGHIATATDGQGKLHPWLRAIGWRLSASHPRRDICDAWAGDDYGLGAGNYPDAGSLPPGHPHCMCYSVSLIAGVDAEFTGYAPEPDACPASQIKYYGQDQERTSTSRAVRQLRGEELANPSPKEAHVLPEHLAKQIPDEIRSGLVKPHPDVEVYEQSGYKEDSRERTIAARVAESGSTVILRRKDETPNETSFDAFMEIDGRMEPVEFKRITEAAVNLAGVADAQLRSAKKQAQNVLIYVDRADYNNQLQDIEAGLSLRLARTKRDGTAIKRVLLVTPDGVIREIAP